MKNDFNQKLADSNVSHTCLYDDKGKFKVKNSKHILYTVLDKTRYKAIRARFSSNFSTTAIELIHKMTDRFTCHINSQPTV